MSENQLRLFVAAALPDELVQYISEQAVKYSQEEWRLVPRQNLHLTLLFIGNVPSERLPQLREKLALLAAAQKPFTLKLQYISPGPVAKSPRLVWAQFELHPAFEQLAKLLQQELAPEVNLPKKQIPHVTVARKKKDVTLSSNAPVLVPEKPLSLQVNEIGLWKSVLGQPHPAYSVLEAFPMVKPE